MLPVWSTFARTSLEMQDSFAWWRWWLGYGVSGGLAVVGTVVFALRRDRATLPVFALWSVLVLVLFGMVSIPQFKLANGGFECWPGLHGRVSRRGIGFPLSPPPNTLT